MTYTISAEGYQTRTLTVMNEFAARSVFASLAGWMLDEPGYAAFLLSLTVVPN